jgi:hypothetical protein
MNYLTPQHPLWALLACSVVKSKAYFKENTARLYHKHHPVKPLTPELNPSAQRCLPRFFTGKFNLQVVRR